MKAGETNMLNITDYSHILLAGILKQRRKEAGVSQAEIADRLHCYQSYISKIENGKLHLEVLTAMQYCDAIGTDFTELVQEFREAQSKTTSDDISL